jgi:hypothetical protein
VHGEGKVAQIFWRYLEAQAEELIDINCPKIEHVAQAHLEHGTSVRRRCPHSDAEGSWNQLRRD